MKINLIQRWYLIIFIVIVTSALAVRLLGTNFGLPYVFFPDEAVLVNHAMAFGTGDLNPHYFIYPALYMYILFIIYGITYVVGWFVGVFHSNVDFVRLFFTDVTPFYLPGRLIASLSGVASVIVVYWLGRRAYNVLVGLIAAAFLSFTVLHVEYSHYVKTHVPASLLVILGLWLAWTIYNGKVNIWRYLLAGIIAGLSASTIYHAGFVLISMMAAHVLHCRNISKNSSYTFLLNYRLIGMIIISLVTFIIINPFIIFDWKTFFSDVSGLSSTFFYGDFWERGFFYHFTSLPISIGKPLGFVALFGLGYALIRHRPSDLILLSQPLFLVLFLMPFKSKDKLHMIIAFPALSILSASFVVDVINWFVRSRIVQPVTLALVTISLLFIPARSSFQNSYHLTLPDTRILAKEWIEKNIPAGSKIVMDSGRYYLGVFSPPLRMSHWTLEQFIRRRELINKEDFLRIEGTGRESYYGEAEYFRWQLRTLDNQSTTYDIFQILHDPGSPRTDVLTFDEYVSTGVQYAIVSSYTYDGYALMRGESIRHPEKAAKYRDFYQSLDNRATLLKEFSPSNKTTGPTLRIYKLPSEQKWD